MDAQILPAPARRLLLEMLVSERAGERALYVGHRFGRDAIAQTLSEQHLCQWVDEQQVVISALGRHIAERLVMRVLGYEGAPSERC